MTTTQTPEQKMREDEIEKETPLHFLTVIRIFLENETDENYKKAQDYLESFIAYRSLQVETKLKEDRAGLEKGVNDLKGTIIHSESWDDETAKRYYEGYTRALDAVLAILKS